jgi:hypothetical protein
MEKAAARAALIAESAESLFRWWGGVSSALLGFLATLMALGFGLARGLFPGSG